MGSKSEAAGEYIVSKWAHILSDKLQIGPKVILSVILELGAPPHTTLGCLQAEVRMGIVKIVLSSPPCRPLRPLHVPRPPAAVYRLGASPVPSTSSQHTRQAGSYGA